MCAHLIRMLAIAAGAGIVGAAGAEPVSYTIDPSHTFEAQRADGR